MTVYSALLVFSWISAPHFPNFWQLWSEFERSKNDDVQFWRRHFVRIARMAVTILQDSWNSCVCPLYILLPSAVSQPKPAKKTTMLTINSGYLQPGSSSSTCFCCPFKSHQVLPSATASGFGGESAGLLKTPECT